jgi:hypothetical protein
MMHMSEIPTKQANSMEGIWDILSNPLIEVILPDDCLFTDNLAVVPAAETIVPKGETILYKVYPDYALFIRKGVSGNIVIGRY